MGSGYFEESRSNDIVGVSHLPIILAIFTRSALVTPEHAKAKSVLPFPTVTMFERGFVFGGVLAGMKAAVELRQDSARSSCL